MTEVPGFNADKVRPPLRMEIDSGPIDVVITHWDMFRRFRPNPERSVPFDNQWTDLHGF